MPQYSNGGVLPATEALRLVGTHGGIVRERERKGTQSKWGFFLARQPAKYVSWTQVLTWRASAYPSCIANHVALPAVDLEVGEATFGN